MHQTFLDTKMMKDLCILAVYDLMSKNRCTTLKWTDCKVFDRVLASNSREREIEQGGPE